MKKKRCKSKHKYGLRLRARCTLPRHHSGDHQDLYYRWSS